MTGASAVALVLALLAETAFAVRSTSQLAEETKLAVAEGRNGWVAIWDGAGISEEWNSPMILWR